MVKRELSEKLIQSCFKNKVILLLGARQVGKTTLLKELVKQINKPFTWLNADEADILEAFTSAVTSTQLIKLIGQDSQLVIIDGAQQIPDIGRKLKLIHDNRSDIQLIITGSSAFDLQDQTSEPLTGRKRTFHLYPISYRETENHTSPLEAKRLLDNRLIFGLYPEVVNNPGHEKGLLIEIAQSYLYKDILKMDGIRKPSHLDKLLKALALQVGSEVSYHELAQTIGNIDTSTVEKYLDLLEKAYVIFKLPAFNRNLRNEIKKGKKYYFYDNGIRNVLINNFTTPELRIDKGALWENFLISERIKSNSYSGRFVNSYFWRTQDQAEIDYIEEYDGILHAFEIKWKEQKVIFPSSFLNTYSNHQTDVVTRNNYDNFLK